MFFFLIWLHSWCMLILVYILMYAMSAWLLSVYLCHVISNRCLDSVYCSNVYDESLPWKQFLALMYCRFTGSGVLYLSRHWFIFFSRYLSMNVFLHILRVSLFYVIFSLNAICKFLQLCIFSINLLPSTSACSAIFR